MQRDFKNSVLGGTFDNLHLGHRKLIDFAFGKSDFVTIGISSNEFARSYKGKNLTNSFELRKKDIEDYLIINNYSARAKIVELKDLYGPTADDPSIEAIFVTDDTRHGAEKINEKRNARNLLPLKIVIFPFVVAANGNRISSSAVKKGAMNVQGEDYWTLFENKNYTIGGHLRSIFAKPQGKLFSTIDELLDSYKEREIVSVGDETSKNLNEIGIKAALYIVDFKIKRLMRFNNLAELGFDTDQKVKVFNPAGDISIELSRAIHDYFTNHFAKVILVDGEEDLAVVPCVLMAPLGTIIIYGQPNEGVVAVEVTEGSKNKFSNYLDDFKLQTIKT
ncbi:pantetheine-phosphate adenylyltransferase [Candidatus Curtissbacteria bacterium]|nr:pantetheine-phosphate adenylyltransferase [Candidatus Curtissbacteria bacterium]